MGNKRVHKLHNFAIDLLSLGNGALPGTVIHAEKKVSSRRQPPFHPFTPLLIALL
jgi:hypothetical protein